MQFSIVLFFSIVFNNLLIIEFNTEEVMKGGNKVEAGS